MLFLLALSALAMATVGSVLVYQRGVAGRLPAGARAALPEKPPPPPPRSTLDPTLETLTVGDVVQDGDSDFVVAGTVRFREEKDAWAHHLLDGGSEKRWLEVRKVAGAVKVAFLEAAADVPTFGALGAGITWRGKPFSLAGKGDARTAVEGDVEGRAPGVLKYTRYSGPGGEGLWLEEEAGKKRALASHEVPPSSLQLLGGELVRQQER